MLTEPGWVRMTVRHPGSPSRLTTPHSLVTAVRKPETRDFVSFMPMIQGRAARLCSMPIHGVCIPDVQQTTNLYMGCSAGAMDTATVRRGRVLALVYDEFEIYYDQLNAGYQSMYPGAAN